MTVPREEAPANSVQAAVIQRCKRCSELLGVKRVWRLCKSGVKALQLNRGSAPETAELEYRRGWRNSPSRGEIRRYPGGTPVAKAATWTDTDAETRKRGEQTGLDTLVVHAVNDER